MGVICFFISRGHSFQVTTLQDRKAVSVQLTKGTIIYRQDLPTSSIHLQSYCQPCQVHGYILGMEVRSRDSGLSTAIHIFFVLEFTKEPRLGSLSFCFHWFLL
jgi:hypothetical protein